MTAAVAERSVINLFPYQQEAFNAVWAAYDGGKSRLLLSMPTGSGKTAVGSHIVREARARGFGRAVFLVHRDELVNQSVNALAMINPNLTVGVCKAERDQLNADIIVASAQTLAREARLARLQAAIAGGDALLLSDEAHHDMAGGRRTVISGISPRLLVGLTATPNRADKVGLDGIYDEIVFHLPILELIAMNRLSKLVGLRIDTETELDGVHTRAGEFAENELETAIDTEARNSLIVESYLRHAQGRRKTVAFCVTVQHAEHLIQAFREAGVHAEGIFGHTPSGERERILSAFSAGDIPVLCNVMVLSEGYDEPGIDCILWCRPTKSQALYIQCIGRGARRSDEKTDCLVIDFVDASSRHKLVSFPSLTGDADEVEEHGTGGGGSLKQGALVDLLEYAQTRKKLRERAAVAVDLFGSSDYLWRTVAGQHMSPTGGNGWLWLREDGDGFVPCLLRETRGEDGKFMTKVRPLFDRALDMETAMGVAENRIDLTPLTGRDAGWRKRVEEPTDGQLRYARALRISIPAGVTKAELAGLIDERTFTLAVRRAMTEGTRA